MSLWQIAARNVWQNRGRYAAYLGSSAFSVMIYFLYTALILHPQLQGGYRGAEYVVQGMKAAAVVIAIFTFLFLLYSNSAFIRSRMKEFGLLSLLGVTRRQLVAMIVWESVAVAAVALGAGLGLGLLFLKLFFMAISTLLQLPAELPFYAGPPVWAQTLLLFGSFFLVVSLLSLTGVLRKSVIELIRAGRQPKAVPTLSRWKAPLGLFLVGGGYIWASIPNSMVVVLGIIPVTAMVSVGTYLLMQEGSIAFLGWLHQRERYFYRPGPFLSVSQLVFKMKENYRVLSAVAILVAVILTAVGTAFSTFVVVADDVTERNPRTIQLTLAGKGDLVPEVGRVEAVLAEHGLNDLTFRQVEAPWVKLGEEKGEMVALPYSLYQALSRPLGTPLPIGAEQNAIRVLSFATPKPYRTLPIPQDENLLLGGQILPLRLVKDDSGALVNFAGVGSDLLILPDQLITDVMAQTPAGMRTQFAFWDSPSWKGAELKAAVAELRTLYPEEGAVHLSTTPEAYQSAIESVGMVLFIGVFVSLVFFAASCSLLYFRLFTEIEDDRKYYRRLQQVGVSSRELRRLAVAQTAVVFFVPFLVGLLHSTFAMKALGSLVMKTVLQYGWLVALCYLVLYALFFRITYAAYWRALRVEQIQRPELAEAA